MRVTHDKFESLYVNTGELMYAEKKQLVLTSIVKSNH